MKSVAVLVLLVYGLIFVWGTGAKVTDFENIEALVRKWAPLVWLHPDEKYFPSSVDYFLENVDVRDEKGVYLGNISRVTSKPSSSKTYYLTTRKPIDKLINTSSSFLHGTNPKETSVPIYAVIRSCSPLDQKGIIDPHNTQINTDKQFHFSVSYWMFYPYNEGKDICFLGRIPSLTLFSRCLGHFKKIGNHVGDWEHMTLLFSGSPVPDMLYIAVHNFGAYYHYDERLKMFKHVSQTENKETVQYPKFPPLVKTQDGHPVLFSALGSHGLWSSPGIFEYNPVPRLSDRNDFGIPWKPWKNIVFHHLGKTRLPDWMAFKGKWGNPKKNCLLVKDLGICEYGDGPGGVLGRKQDFSCRVGHRG